MIYGLGNDDLVFLGLGIIAIYIIAFWLIKIYKRVRQIAKLQEHYFIDHMKEAHNEEVYFD